MSRASQIYFSFLIILTSVILWILPFTEAGHAFKTDLREDNFTVNTAVAVTSANVQLFKTLYTNDTSSIDLYSHDIDDMPLVSSYNVTTRALLISGLAGNTTRTIDVNYDVDALSGIPVLSTLIDKFPFIWILMTLCLPIVGLMIIWKTRI